jgi:hypothetical protein
MNQLCEIAHSLESDILSGPELPSETNYHLHEALDKLQAVIAGTPAPMSYRGGVVRDVAKKIDALEARGLEHSALDDAIAEFDAQVSERIATAEATELQAQISELIARRDDQDDDDAAEDGAFFTFDMLSPASRQVAFEEELDGGADIPEGDSTEAYIEAQLRSYGRVFFSDGSRLHPEG